LGGIYQINLAEAAVFARNVYYINHNPTCCHYEQKIQKFRNDLSAKELSLGLAKYPRFAKILGKDF
jgi:hypothetical protein